MLYKRDRTHSCGNSNIDFRSLKDETNIKKFQPWNVKKNFGTMGYSDYHLKFKEYKDFMSPTKLLNTVHDKKQEFPNPKLYNTAVLYNINRVPVKVETFNSSDKIAELDESFVGKEKYIGDSMMIAEVTKSRRKLVSLNTSLISESEGTLSNA